MWGRTLFLQGRTNKAVVTSGSLQPDLRKPIVYKPLTLEQLKLNYLMRQFLALLTLFLCCLSCKTQTEKLVVETISDPFLSSVPDTSNSYIFEIADKKRFKYLRHHCAMGYYEETKLAEISNYLDFCGRIIALARKNNAIIPYRYN